MAPSIKQSQLSNSSPASKSNLMAGGIGVGVLAKKHGLRLVVLGDGLYRDRVAPWIPGVPPNGENGANRHTRVRLAGRGAHRRGKSEMTCPRLVMVCVGLWKKPATYIL